MKQISDTLFVAISDAHEAARRAHDLACKEDAPYLLRTRLGTAQSILAHYVTKHAGLNVRYVSKESKERVK